MPQSSGVKTSSAGETAASGLPSHAFGVLTVTLTAPDGFCARAMLTKTGPLVAAVTLTRPGFTMAWAARPRQESGTMCRAVLACCFGCQRS